VAGGNQIPINHQRKDGSNSISGYGLS